MRARLEVLGHILKLCFTLRPLTTVCILAVMVFDAVSVTVLALVQGRLVQQTGHGVNAALVIAVCLGALVLVVMMVGHRLMFSLQRDVMEAVEVRLADDLLAWTTAPATVEHLEDPVFLDRLSVVVRRTSNLIWALWSALFVVMSVISVVVSLTVLARINPWLIGLCLAAIPPILLAGKSGDLYITAVDKNAELLRLEADLSDVVTTPSSLKEVIISGLGGSRR